MIRTLILICACLVGITTAKVNPAAGKPWHWKSPKPLVVPKGVPRVPRDARIVGGNETIPHAWPHQVALFIDDMWFCGGSLISNEWIMTAAHCMDGAWYVDVVMGAHNINNNEPSQVVMTSFSHFVHENWDSYELSNDIALIRLPSPVVFNEYINAVKLPAADPFIGTVVTPTGWGRPSDFDDNISDILRQVDVPTMNNADCNIIYGIILNSHICIDTITGKGTCNGDSGGPLNYNNVTIGITSFGASAGCEVGYPDGFTRVTYFLDWIEANTGITP
ncbi:hypothetical protein SK128_015607 [Halocaridina rubra]|uniref:Peptidase S1 domain-containing protein n=1 Tax=Halocaridina rubra TaxID=373956 RepID=A0AAN8WJQ6_HALRR